MVSCQCLNCVPKLLLVLVTQSQMACFREPETAIDTITRSWHVTFIQTLSLHCAQLWTSIKGCVSLRVIVQKNTDPKEP